MRKLEIKLEQARNGWVLSWYADIDRFGPPEVGLPAGPSGTEVFERLEGATARINELFSGAEK